MNDNQLQIGCLYIHYCYVLYSFSLLFIVMLSFSVELIVSLSSHSYVSVRIDMSSSHGRSWYLVDENDDVDVDDVEAYLYEVR